MNLTKYEKDLQDKLNNIYGLRSCTDIVMHFYKYAKLRNTGEITGVGNFNITLICEENVDTRPMIDVLLDILKQQHITSKDGHYVSRLELKNDKAFETIDEDVIIIDTLKLNSYTRFGISDIRKRIAENSDKIFILVVSVNDMVPPEYLAEFCWIINTTVNSIDDKKEYIITKLNQNNISVANDLDYIDEVLKEDDTDIESIVLTLVMMCKENNITKLTNDIARKFLIRDNDTANLNKYNTKTGMQELDELIGLEDIKTEIKKIVNYVVTSKDRHQSIMLHMSLMGPSGCGKNEIAKIVGRIFKEYGILSKGDFIEVSRSDLVGQYIGQSENKTRRILEEGRGSVIYFDEAYSINQIDSTKDFGHVVIAELIKYMEDYRDDMCIIFGGYTHEMEELLKANRGFNSRVPFKLYFKDYTADELYLIFRKMAKSNNYKMAGNIKSILIEHFEKARKVQDFGNRKIC